MVEWVHVEGVLMTTERIPAYGGLAFPREMLDEIAAAIRGGAVPFHLDHDLTKPLRTRDLTATVRERPDKEHELRFGLSVHPDDVALFGSRTGMSATIAVPIARPEGYVSPSTPSFELSADAAWFSTEDLLSAEAVFLAVGIDVTDIRVERVLQFSFVPDPQIFVTLGSNILAAIGAKALWSGLARLFRGRKTPPGGDASKPTTINITLRDGERSVIAVIATDSEDVAFRAIEALETFGGFPLHASGDAGQRHEAIERVVTWNDESREWVPPK